MLGKGTGTGMYGMLVADFDRRGRQNNLVWFLLFLSVCLSFPSMPVGSLWNVPWLGYIFGVFVVPWPGLWLGDYRRSAGCGVLVMVCCLVIITVCL